MLVNSEPVNRHANLLVTVYLTQSNQYKILIKYDIIRNVIY